LQLAEPTLDLTQLKGDFRFDSSKGLSGQNISAQAFDRPITAQIVADGKPVVDSDTGMISYKDANGNKQQINPSDVKEMVETGQ